MKIVKYILAGLCLTQAVSCNKLDEVPKDFLTPDNSFIEKSGFEAALGHIYLQIRDRMYANKDEIATFDMLGIDVDFAHVVNANREADYFFWNTINKDSGFAQKWWQRFYDWINKANVIIDRADRDVAKWNSEEEKNQIVAEARFLRAFAYHFLANMWGGVPLVLQETIDPKFDYVRATQEEVYLQCKADLEYAIQWMPTIDQLKGGRAPRAAAYHLLSEVNISLGDYQGAIAAASAVIDDPKFGLMIERFGNRTDFTFHGYRYQGESQPWGDVYWDLFQEGNMNWSEGNTEAIWNIQLDPDVQGGGFSGTYINFGIERWWNPGWWGQKDINGVTNLLKDTLNGRPVGGIAATYYTDSLIWQYHDDWDRDIRNSNYNIQRTFYWTNPASVFYGQAMTRETSADLQGFINNTKPSFKKSVTTVHYGKNKQDGQNHDDGRIYKDWYIMRLAETYLLRAEAYLNQGNLQLAAADINTVRSRAQATPVDAGEVTVDLLLDERARELYMEEFRLSTLMRTGKLAEYLMKYNTLVKRNGYQIPEFKNKLPIPQSEVEANKESPLEQNQGY